MDYQTELIPVTLEDGTEIKVEATLVGEQEVGVGGKYSFDLVGESIVAIASQLTKSIQSVKPDKATLKFGLELGLETGSLYTIIAKGSAKSTLEVTLEWNSQPKQSS